MAKLIISDFQETIVVKGKFLGFIPNDKKFFNHYLLVRKPNGFEEKYFIGAERIFPDNHKELVDVTYEQFFQKRTNKIQDLVNKFENEKFKVRNDQLALFIKNKLETLILEN